MKELLTSKEVASYIGTSNQTVKDWITAGLKTVAVGRTGRHRRIKKEWVDEFINATTTKTIDLTITASTPKVGESLQPFYKKLREEYGIKYKNRK